jgi:hypothetical protein
MRHNVLKGKNLLLVNTGSTHKRHVLKRLKQLELNIIALNKEKNWAQPYVDHWIITDNTNHQMALNALDQFIKDNPEIKIDGVLTFWEDDVLLTSKLLINIVLWAFPRILPKEPGINLISENSVVIMDFLHQDLKQ